MDYNHLKGKEIICYRPPDGKRFKGFVAGIDEKIGITIKYLNTSNSVLNREGYFFCINNSKEINKKQYAEEFLWLLNSLEAGLIDGTEYQKEFTLKVPTPFSKMVICAFK